MGGLDLRELAKGELPALQKRQGELEERIKTLITRAIPRRPQRAARNPRRHRRREASLSANELFRMYTATAERHRWKVESLSLSTRASAESRK